MAQLESVKSIVGFFFFVSACAAAGGSGCSNDSPWVALDNGPEGILVKVGSPESTFLFQVANRSLPSLCQRSQGGAHHRCYAFLEGGRFLVISGVRSLIFLNLLSDSSQLPYMVELTESRSFDDCDPTDLFVTREEGIQYLRVACIGVIEATGGSSSSSSLTYLEYFLDVTESAVTAIDSGQVLVRRQSQSGFSETILSQDVPCLGGSGHSYFSTVAGDTILSFPASTFGMRDFIQSETRLQNCTSVSFLEQGAGGDVIVHCSNNDLNNLVISYSICNEHAEYHYVSQGGLLFPCHAPSEEGGMSTAADAVAVLYSEQTVDVVESSNHSVVLYSVNHTLGLGEGGIGFGRCLESGGSFAGILPNGTLFLVQFSVGSISAIADVCDGGTCIRPSFSGAFFLVYDVPRLRLLSVRSLENCPQPVISELYSDSSAAPSFISTAAAAVPTTSPPSEEGESSSCVCDPQDTEMTTTTPLPPDNLTMTTDSVAPGGTLDPVAPGVSPDSVAPGGTPFTTPDTTTNESTTSGTSVAPRNMAVALGVGISVSLVIVGGAIITVAILFALNCLQCPFKRDLKPVPVEMLPVAEVNVNNGPRKESDVGGGGGSTVPPTASPAETSPAVTPDLARGNGDNAMLVNENVTLLKESRLRPDQVRETHQRREGTEDQRNNMAEKMHELNRGGNRN